MIDRIRKKIKSFTESLQSLQRMQGDDMALNQLLKMFDNGVFLPLTGWSISPREVLHICNDITINRRKRIVEFGSGFSTICIAQHIKISGREDIRFYSVENNEDWAIELRAILVRMGLDRFATIVSSPISSIGPELALEQQAKWYDATILERELTGLSEVDLVIVDGPYGGTTPFARYSAVPFLKPKLSANCAIFLDDSSRPHEARILKEWEKILNLSVRNFKRYAYISNENSFDVAPFK